jgi:signal transduction histidine kinase
MARSDEERDRMLASAASVMGTVGGAAAFVLSVVPGVLPDPASIVAVAVLSLLTAAAAVALGRRTSPVPVVVGLAACVLGIGVVAASAGAGRSAAAAVVLLAATAGSSGFLLGAEPRRRVILAVAFVVVVGVTVPTDIALNGDGRGAVLIVCGSWIFCAGISIWVSRMLPQTVSRIGGMSGAYRAERQASEREARRRQSARLLHDTVLATLTLLAHSGVGVGEQALRTQAAEDAALLRQLRMGYNPNPAASGDYRLRQTQESTLGNTLESVKQRFQRMGLDVEWHGTGHLLLPPATLDAFLLALAECLENVRRHSGESEAHVTITDDEITVRAMVTDSGVGFDLGAVSPGRLGFAESIVARMRDVGGNARLFSAPGSGTTVVLEVPKA